ncbi:unnamed protein product [Adineta steineri]|uniref:Uncharacterized protein n=1 Tax=Adineta steineri TaxID=433720 RepID=A0A813Z9L0_9BILA|nr:unnamed protein product [Adineta steineri]
MNTSYDLDSSTPNIINRNKYFESLMDFSTPMSTISTRWMNNTKTSHSNEKISSDNSQNSTVINDTIVDMNDTIIDKLLQKFNEHKINFHNTQNYLNLLDNHLCEITTILNQLQNPLSYNSLLKPTTDELETRLLQMSIKREQIRTAINNFHQSPTITETLNDIIQQISPSTSKRTDSTISYSELINAIKLSMKQKTNLIEHFYQEEIHMKHRINDYYSKMKQRQYLLLQLVEKILEQQKENEKYVEEINLDKPQFDKHSEQLTEFNKLNEEYQLLQDENRLLKYKTKENINKLYTFINQTTE